nr:MAG TPA: hypothetical protein [Caudoviricetes sp.]
MGEENLIPPQEEESQTVKAKATAKKVGRPPKAK